MSSTEATPGPTAAERHRLTWEQRIPRCCPICGKEGLELQPFARQDHPTASDYDCYCRACTWSGNISPDLTDAQVLEADAPEAWPSSAVVVLGRLGLDGTAPLPAPLLARTGLRGGDVVRVVLLDDLTLRFLKSRGL